MKFMNIPLVALMAMTCVSFLPAQGGSEEEQVDIQELVRQIRRNMVDIEKEIDRVEAESSKEASEKAQQNIQKLVDSLKGRGSQITTDIDEIIKNLKANGGGSGSCNNPSQSKSQGNKPQSRNRNQRQNQGDQPQDGKPQNGQKENNTAEDQPGGRNQRGKRKSKPEKVKIPVNWDKERWGHLPAELRQLLIDRNFKTIAPTYEQALREYYKRIGRGGQ